MVDLKESLATLARNEHVQPNGMLKLNADLERYARIIEATKPEILVETGTRTGQSALWFARQGLDVITIDVLSVSLPPAPEAERVTCLVGDSVDPETIQHVRDLVDNRRTMVSLDSDHSAAHVRQEIALYGLMVSPGCYLVVEDGIFGYAKPALRAQHGLGHMVGSPILAIFAELVGEPGWTRDVLIECLSPVTHHPFGFWRRND